MKLEMHTGIVMRRSDTYNEDGSIEVMMQSEDGVVDVDAGNYLVAEPLHLSSADNVSPVAGQKVFVIGFEDSSNQDDRYFWVGLETSVKFPDLSYDLISRVMADEDGNRIIFGAGKIQIDQVGEDFTDEDRKIGRDTDFETESDSEVTNKHINRIYMRPGSIKTMQIKRDLEIEKDSNGDKTYTYEEEILQMQTMDFDISDDKEGFRSAITMQQKNGNFIDMVNQKDNQHLKIQISGEGGEKAGHLRIDMAKDKERIVSKLHNGTKKISSIIDMTKGKENVTVDDEINENKTVMDKDGLNVTIKTDIKIIAEGNVSIENDGDAKVVAKGDVNVEGKKVEVKGTEVKITGGKAIIGGSVAPTGKGALCGVPACLFTGAPHVGDTASGT